MKPEEKGVRSGKPWADLIPHCTLVADTTDPATESPVTLLLSLLRRSGSRVNLIDAGVPACGRGADPARGGGAGAPWAGGTPDLLLLVDTAQNDNLEAKAWCVGQGIPYIILLQALPPLEPARAAEEGGWLAAAHEVVSADETLLNDLWRTGRLASGRGWTLSPDAAPSQPGAQRLLAAIHRALLPVKDYVSPGLALVQPDRAFPEKVVGNTAVNGWPYLRREIPHNWYVDRRVPTVGFVSRDEAHILYNTARLCAGLEALEIGCFLGWSTCHLALGGVRLDVVDPLLGRDDFRPNVEDSLRRAGVRERVNLVGDFSPAGVEKLYQQRGRGWDLIFIDGDHEGDGPLRDAEVAARYAAEEAIILFHDLAAPAVARAFDHFRNLGWNSRLYATMQIMGAVWRGKKEPLRHLPDPAITWPWPSHLTPDPAPLAERERAVDGERITICYGVNRDYLRQLSVSLLSLLHFNDPEKLEIFVLLDRAGYEQRELVDQVIRRFRVRIHYILIEDVYKHLHGFYTSATYFRLSLPAMVQRERVIYLDADTVIEADLSPLWATDLAGALCAGVQDFGFVIPDHSRLLGLKQPYINSGVLLLDLAGWRREKIAEQVVEFVDKNPHKIRFADQDGINWILDGRKQLLPEKWNLYCSHADWVQQLERNPQRIIHLVSLCQAWSIVGPKPLRQIWEHYEYFTPWRGTPLSKPDNLLARIRAARQEKSYGGDELAWETLNESVDILVDIALKNQGKSG